VLEHELQVVATASLGFGSQSDPSGAAPVGAASCQRFALSAGFGCEGTS
jgi:hypothetical protein